ncbi:hypothetical protein CAC42_7896 [Sphaceloma murrayae]|uniref:U1-type domain-containing protein n=1 Tax=Sphaceloma murrayae TaxID=2082308 RepID=A0A2K1QY42_9PEZI|nr:hypothetical protein CAC42_7896 [Sphaceloma murrayae]
MSEYWKSTPKYWCKFCKVFVRDTPIEKKQHEATGKHQGAIQKSLRELHKTQSREEREKQRAKDEVARISGGPAAKGAARAGPSHVPAVSVAKSKPTFTRVDGRATADERMKQAEQLAAMGVAVPDEFRKDMAIASEWSTVSATPVYHRRDVKEETRDGNEDEGKVPPGSLAGKRRRESEADDDDGLDRVNGKRKVWGTTLKAYPGAKGSNGEDFEALLSGSVIKKESVSTQQDEVKGEEDDLDGVQVKKEESVEDALGNRPTSETDVSVPIDAGPKGENVDTPVIFKKRKGKR